MGKLATALYGLLCAPAMACDLDGSYADAQRTATGAEVYLQNNLAASTMDAVQCVFSMGDGLAVVVIWTHAPGNDPDSAVIIPPPGYMAIPPEVTLDEGAGKRVLIVPEASA